jgi:hypothetical protein
VQRHRRHRFVHGWKPFALASRRRSGAVSPVMTRAGVGTPVAAQVLDGVDACLTVGETEAIVHGAHQVGQLSGAPGAAGDRGMISNVQLAVVSETFGRPRRAADSACETRVGSCAYGLAVTRRWEFVFVAGRTGQKNPSQQPVRLLLPPPWGT